MKLAFLVQPVENIKESLKFYRDQLGFEEAWREGNHTIALQMPGTDVQLMIEDDEIGLPPGGLFVVDNVDKFFAENKDTLTFVKEPMDIPPGRYAIFNDVSNNVIRILDLTNDK
ncbi:VOC family protein [Chengkuizengella axinellae]|uniref:VOC family protein n=1 Tax=Chengkuizengella axinellae TaxID=3064388 RepID=A0ABT9J186_9BACL|nr:VOC family protein [Chengkuizengella sp. 2205SS18-9]MDP5275386.1 VOC family protein [Chengkuizengella sp. 2205SS18-9]